ncbi:MAG: hypothetical protein WCD45_00520 [Gallionella sp.]
MSQVTDGTPGLVTDCNGHFALVTTELANLKKMLLKWLSQGKAPGKNSMPLPNIFYHGYLLLV